MAFFDKLNDLARNIGDKANEAIGTTKMNSKINSEKAAIVECYRQIGELYYKRHQEGSPDDPETAELLLTIDKHNEVIAETQAEIARIQAENAAQQAKAAAPAAPAAAVMAPGAVEGTAPIPGGAICTSCGKANPPGTRFCSACGQGLPEVVTPPAGTCPDCGFENQPGTNFCGGCGAKI